MKREDPQAGSGEFDGERQTIEAATDLGDGSKVSRVRVEARCGRGCPDQEELDGIGLSCARRIVHDVEGRCAQGPLAAHAEYLAACGQDAQTGAARQVALGEQRSRAHDRFTVVEHQRQLALSQPVLERVGCGLIQKLGHAQHGSHQRDDPVVPRDRETHEPHPVPERRQRLGGRLQRQSCLADASGPSQSDEPAVAERAEHIGELALPPDERIDGRGQVGPREGVQRAERRELSRQIGMGHLKQPLRPPKVTQPVLAEVHDPALLGHRVVEEFFGRKRHDHLAAVRHRHQPGGTVHDAAVVITGREPRPRPYESPSGHARDP